MKRNTLLALTLFTAAICKGQYFNNVNTELCYELYRVKAQPSEYRVYMVIDEETTPQDTAIFKKWKHLSQQQKTEWVRMWNMAGKRIEAEPKPYISYEAVFPRRIKFPE